MNVKSKKYKIGNVEVTRISDLILDNYTHASLLPDWNSLTNQQKMESTGSMEAKTAFMSNHTWLVKTRNHTILVDTGVGNYKDRPFTPYFDNLDTPYLQNLRDAGVKPEDVDYVLTTHLHVDHVGWNTRLSHGEWVPTFPRAKYVFSKKEYEYFKDPANKNDRNKTSVIIQKDSVEPIVEAGLAEMIDIDGSDFIDGLTFEPTPGHTVDHASITLTSKGENAIFSGDLFHNPLQIHYPEFNSIFDAFDEKSRTSRLWGIHYAIENDATVFSSHFAESSAGVVRKQGKKFDWEYLI